MYKVSVIVPVYNSEKYLERCLESLINQTFKDIEIIVINDGSTDNSLDLLIAYEKKDKRINLINNVNQGISKSRNLGIGVAKGEYIMFVDSDDWIDIDMIEKMYQNIILDMSDLVMCAYISEFGTHSKIKGLGLKRVGYYEEEDIKNKLLRKVLGPTSEELKNPEALDSLGTVWAKLYRKNIIEDNNINFIELNEIGTGEDILFTIQILNKSKRVYLLNSPMYHYWRKNSDSITSKYIPNFIEKRKKYFRYFSDFIKENKLGREFQIALNNRICISTMGMELIECSQGNNISIRNKINNINLILNEPYIKEAYKNLDLKYFKIHWKVFYFLNKYRSSFLSFLMIRVIEFLRTRV